MGTFGIIVATIAVWEVVEFVIVRHLMKTGKVFIHISR